MCCKAELLESGTLYCILGPIPANIRARQIMFDVPINTT